MSQNQYVLAINPCVANAGSHDPSAVLFKDGEIVFGVEEERFTRQKHAMNTFPKQAIDACLDAEGLSLREVDKIAVSWDPSLFRRALPPVRRQATETDSVLERAKFLGWRVRTETASWLSGRRAVKQHLREMETSLPPVEFHEHHACHAASAFYPTPFEEALVVSLDGRGEHDATSVWWGTEDGLRRLRTYEYANSLGFFYGAVTQFLGFRANNGEGKVMGLAPYGSPNEDIESALRSVITTGADYDVTALSQGFGYATNRLEDLFDRPRKESPTDFTQWEKDLAFATQSLVEEIVTDIVRTYCERLGTGNVGLAGGVALNCKMNKRVMELDCVDDLFIQPVSNDAGSALGAGMREYRPDQVPPMTTAYWGPEYSVDQIEDQLQTNKISYSRPDDVERVVAERIADGALVGWFQGRLEMGPRALGNRSILADPRTRDSLDRVNKFVKHREEWRPFAPSMLEEAIDEYLHHAEPSPYMIKTFDPKAEKKDDIRAVLHPADDTTRPQTVREDQNPRYHRLLTEFEDVTGVPVLLNTSFNDHGEPIVNTPSEAIKDFFGMGLDLLVLGDVLVEKRDASQADRERLEADVTQQATD
ncbi:carbamoyltransferase [Halogeometricum sp. S1BR25-6]|uniref:Carbamoyltransferase n=1 Tax=Halogeometricum salsisoli TaxID=2950536 RepID=A0ABU2GHI8_9EURY|nr:carbamoyltransferase C-terminal domain-containing protein [Halogeometricum sp. S1BR25-6]MDS0300285.1 carbamoyltransferase [Halogeometricum sp. S1BR25-6]